MGGRAALAARPRSRAAAATSRTLEDFLAARPAGLDLLRLVLAVLVLVSHSWTLGGFGAEPHSPLGSDFLTLGGFAVAGFFALSGLLVGRSAMRRSIGAFAVSRAVRILPAYWVALVVSAFGAALIGWIHERGVLRGFFTTEPGGPVTYVLRGALLPIEFDHGILGVFARSTPFGLATDPPTSWVNGSLWTLPYEVRCYLVLGVVAMVAKRWGGPRTITAAWLATGAAAAAHHWEGDATRAVLGPYVDDRLAMLLFVFLSGALAAVFARSIALVGPWTVVALLLALVAGTRSLFFAEHVSQAALVLLLPPIGALLDPLARLLRGVDLSYGVYLYAWPSQQVVAMYGWASSPWTFVATSLVPTVALAAASWSWVEAPLLRRFRPR